MRTLNGSGLRLRAPPDNPPHHIISTVFQLVLLGSGFAAAAAIQPGPLQAFLLSRVLRDGWRRTLPAAFAPVLSDGPIALLMLFLLRAMPVWLQSGLRVAGGVTCSASRGRHSATRGSINPSRTCCRLRQGRC